MKLDKKYERFRPSGLWTVKFFVNDHYIDTLYAVLHKKGEDPSQYIRLLREKMTRSGESPPAAARAGNPEGLEPTPAKR